MRTILLTMMLVWMGINVSISYASDKSVNSEITRLRVNQFVEWLHDLGDLKKSISRSENNRYFADNYKKYTNGQLSATNVEAINNRRTLLLNQYKSAYIQLPIQFISVSNNEAKIEYNVDFIARNGNHKRVHNIATLTFDEAGKITEFKEKFAGYKPMEG